MPGCCLEYTEDSLGVLERPWGTLGMPGYCPRDSSNKGELPEGCLRVPYGFLRVP